MESKFSDQTFSFTVAARTQDSGSQHTTAKVKEAACLTDDIKLRDA